MADDMVIHVVYWKSDLSTRLFEVKIARGSPARAFCLPKHAYSWPGIAPAHLLVARDDRHFLFADWSVARYDWQFHPNTEGITTIEVAT